MAGVDRAVGGEVVWPHKWSVINLAERESVKRIVSGTECEVVITSNVQISIHDIPEQRFGDALKQMSDHYLVEDSICKSLKVKQYPIAVKEFHKLWKYILHQRRSIGAFRVNPDGSLGELVGVNLLYVSTDKTENRIWDLKREWKSAGIKNMLALFHNLSLKVDICEDYGVDNYLASMGLSVQTANFSDFNFQEIAVQLLETRVDIGHAYGITVTSSFFTDSAARVQAKRAGFETKAFMKYAEILLDDESPVFPDSGGEEVHLMVKSLL